MDLAATEASSHYAVFFQFGVSWSGLCSCPAGCQNPASEALSGSGTQETFQVIPSIGPFPPGGFLLGEASLGLEPSILLQDCY